IGSENYGTETGGYGIFIQNTTAHFVIKNCVVQKYLFGIGFSNVRNGKIYNVTLYDNGIGILLMRADFNNISSNKIYNNKGGILLINSLGNIITSNDVYNNSRGGIALEGYSSNNKIYLNNFNNPQNVYLETHYKNFWNSSEKLTYVYDGKTFENYLGNYWGDYRRNDSDG
ncbi:MAG: NosD domain-containing protein, partial [Archaeoglobaceae archaeon]